MQRRRRTLLTAVTFRPYLRGSSGHMLQRRVRPRASLEALETRLALSGGATILDNAQVGYSESFVSANTVAVTAQAGDEQFPHVIASPSGNLHLVYAGGPAGAAHLYYAVKTPAATGAWGAP